MIHLTAFIREINLYDKRQMYVYIFIMSIPEIVSQRNFFFTYSTELQDKLSTDFSLQQNTEVQSYL